LTFAPVCRVRKIVVALVSDEGDGMASGPLNRSLCVCPLAQADGIGESVSDAFLTEVSARDLAVVCHGSRAGDWFLLVSVW